MKNDSVPVGMNNDDFQVGGSHYKDMKIQPWHALEAWFEPAEFRGFLAGSVVKYVARAGRKDAYLLELKKAQHCLAKLIQFVEDGQ